MSELLKYSLQIIATCLITFGIHILVLFLLNKPLFVNQIFTAYTGNLFLAIIIVVGIIKAPLMYNDSLGFLFLFGSLLKFGFFFLVFYSNFKSDGAVQRTEFFTFFTPYAASLIVQTKCLTDRLSK